MELSTSPQLQSRETQKMSQFGSEKSGMSSLYSTLSADSLRAVSMENGVQYTAIYWETGHRTWLPFWASFSQKFTWKIIDDQIRRFLGFTKSVATEPFVFFSPQLYMRKYFGDPDVYVTYPLEAKSKFSFWPSGVDTFEKRDLQVQAAAAKAIAADPLPEEQRVRMIDAILRSAALADGM